MAEIDSSGQDGQSGNGEMPQVNILAQYIKDLSFENPHAPDSLRSGAGQPKIDIGVNVGAKRQSDDVFEVELKLTANATQGEGETARAAFIVELLYAGAFALKNVPQEHMELFLLVEAPRILFPFARRILADSTRDGGFPPLMLDPIDFAQLYFARQEQAQEGQQAGGAGGQIENG